MSALLIRLPRPCIERSLDCPGWYVIQGDHAWLCGDRRQALREFARLDPDIVRAIGADELPPRLTCISGGGK
jgi:hypothetical protein